MFTGGDPGPDRVVVGSWDGTNAAFCGEFLSLSFSPSPLFLSFFSFLVFFGME